MNTRISYQYRDADNYKFGHEAVVEGEIAPDQIKAMMACLDDGEYFIPALVGLPCEYATGYGFDPQSDHPFCEISEDGFSPTEDAPTIAVKPAELVAAFEKAKGRWIMPDPDAWPASSGPSASRAELAAKAVSDALRNGTCPFADGK